MTRTVVFAREQLRAPFTLALLVAIPALFVVSAAGVLSDFASALGLAGRRRGGAQRRVGGGIHLRCARVLPGRVLAPGRPAPRPRRAGPARVAILASPRRSGSPSSRPPPRSPRSSSASTSRTRCTPPSPFLPSRCCTWRSGSWSGRSSPRRWRLAAGRLRLPARRVRRPGHDRRLRAAVGGQPEGRRRPHRRRPGDRSPTGDWVKLVVVTVGALVAAFLVFVASARSRA